jgi:hypothetical protein
MKTSIVVDLFEKLQRDGFQPYCDAGHHLPRGKCHEEFTRAEIEQKKQQMYQANAPTLLRITEDLVRCLIARLYARAHHIEKGTGNNKSFVTHEPPIQKLLNLLWYAFNMFERLIDREFEKNGGRGFNNQKTKPIWDKVVKLLELRDHIENLRTFIEIHPQNYTSEKFIKYRSAYIQKYNTQALKTLKMLRDDLCRSGRKR